MIAYTNGTSGRQSIRVGDLYRCPRSIQLEFLNYQQDPEKYETVRGRWLHLLFEQYLKMPSIPMNSYYKEVMRDYVDTAYNDRYVRSKLNEDMVLYENKIKDFFMRNGRGRKLREVSKDIQVETLLRVPVENLKLDLPFQLEVQQKYCLSGKFDFKHKNQIVEIKSAKELRSIHKMQAFTYCHMLDILEPEYKHGSVYILLGDEKVKVQKNPFYTWKPWKTNPIAILKERVTNVIENFEKIQMNKEMIEVERKNDCQFCSYYSSCLSVFKPRTGWRTIPK